MPFFLFFNPDHKYYFHKYSWVFLLDLEDGLCLKAVEQLKWLINYQIISAHHCKSSPDEHSQKADGLSKYLDLSVFSSFWSNINTGKNWAAQSTLIAILKWLLVCNRYVYWCIILGARNKACLAWEMWGKLDCCWCFSRSIAKLGRVWVVAFKQ